MIRMRAATPLALLLALAASPGMAGPLLERIAERRQPAPAEAAAAGVSVLRDVAYGSDPRQRFDVYLPGAAATPSPSAGAPVIFMVHGGGWRTGSKSEKAVVDNKVAHWVPKGVVLVSTGYRLLPQADPLTQARDVARALTEAQRQAPSWGADPARFVLMGHSAGAHLVALLASAPHLAREAGAGAWLGTVALDSAAFDLVAAMRDRHLPLYDEAFGSDPTYWRSASPLHQLHAGARPLLAVCSSRRADPCPQARRYADAAAALGVRAAVLPQDYSHRDINLQLGADARYTAAVDDFLASLDGVLARRLGR